MFGITNLVNAVFHQAMLQNFHGQPRDVFAENRSDIFRGIITVRDFNVNAARNLGENRLDVI